MSRVLAIAIALVGCGRFGFDANGDAGALPADAGLGLTCMRSAIVEPAIYVDPTLGEDVNAGTIGSPLKTITHAVAIASPGTMIVARKGNYLFEPNDEVLVTKSSLRFFSETRYGAHVDRFAVTSEHDVSIEGFEIGGSFPSAVQLNDTQRITIRDNLIHHSGTAGIRIAGDNVAALVEANDLYDNANAHVHVDSDSQATIRDNVMFDNLQQDSFPLLWLEGAYDTLVSGNVIFHSSRPLTSYGTIALGTVANVTIENNAIGLNDPAHTSNGAVGLDDASGTATIRYNTFIGPFPGSAFGLERNAGTTGSTTILVHENIWYSGDPTTQQFSTSAAGSTDGFSLDRNLYWNPPTGAFSQANNSYGPTNDPRALVANPGFPGPVVPLPIWQAASGTFQDGSTTVCAERLKIVDAMIGLPPSSAATGASLDPAPATDIRGHARPSPASIGAYEP